MSKVALPQRGGCLCGAVRYEARGAPKFAFNCYCATCRKESGAGHATVAAFESALVEVSGVTREIVVARADGAPPIPRHFCPECGTTLFALPVQLPGMTMIRAGTLDDSAGLAIEGSAFTEQAAPWDPPQAEREANP